MEFRKATRADLPALMTIIDEAIQLLKSQGSPQWQHGYGPSIEKITQDIQMQTLYVLAEQEILALGALIPGVDPVYTAIEEGSWEGTGPYLSIHRVAVSQKAAGRGLAKQLLRSLIEESRQQGITDVRIDTHEQNQGMQKAILSTGFIYRGSVHFPIPDGKRRAYQNNW